MKRTQSIEQVFKKNAVEMEKNDEQRARKGDGIEQTTETEKNRNEQWRDQHSLPSKMIWNSDDETATQTHNVNKIRQFP